MADALISQLTAAGALTSADLMEMEQGISPANQSVKITLGLLQTFILANLTLAAADVDIADVGGYFTGTEVEAALQQIGAELAAIAAGSIQTVTTTATLTPVATNDKVVVSAQVGALSIATPSGTAAEGQGFVIAIYSAAAAAISFSADYRAMGAALPTTTVAGKWTYIPVMRNQTDSKWDVFVSSQQA